MTEVSFQSQESELEKTKKEREEYLAGWKRAKADLINYQKDEAKRFEEVVRFSNVIIIKDLLAVLDSFASFEKNPAQSKQDMTGFLAIQSQIQDILKKNGLEKMAVTVGENFNPQFHESVGEAESDQPESTVTEVVADGYILNERTLRPAKVRLAKSK